MNKTGTILIVDDDDDILTAGRLLLQRQFADVVTCRLPEQVPALLGKHPVDAILLDMNFGPGESSGEQGLSWLRRILEIDPDAVVVMITAHGNVDTAVEAMKLGATDFVTKPWQNEKVVATVSAAVKLHRSRIETDSLRKTNKLLLEQNASGSPHIIAESPGMMQLLDIVRRAAPTDANVLLLGENGTGKELIAREIHRQSSRSERVFLSIDMGSISETLFESELFGHRKGAFTDASEDRIGRFLAADGGTLFLDEVGNLPLHLQTKLLSVLEQRRITPVGSNTSRGFDVRIVAATNVPPGQLRDANYFRPDLLFRLKTVELIVPPLRDRPEDVLPIARHYLDLYSKKYGGRQRRFSQAAERAMLDYEWPGNVRALLHAVERAVILAEDDVLDAEDLQLERTAQDMPHAPSILNLDQLEKETIQKALRKHDYNISRTASELGLTRASLYRRMEKHGL